MLKYLVSPHVLIAPVQWGSRTAISLGCAYKRPKAFTPHWKIVGQSIYNANPADAAKILNNMTARDAGHIFYWAKPKLTAMRVMLMDKDKAASALDQVTNPQNDPDRSSFWVQYEGQFIGIIKEMLSISPSAVDIFVKMEPKNAARGLDMGAYNRHSVEALKTIQPDKAAQIINLLSEQFAAWILDRFPANTAATILSGFEDKKVGKILNEAGYESGRNIIISLDSAIKSAQRMGRILTSVDKTDKAAHLFRAITQVRQPDYVESLQSWMYTIDRGSAVNIICKAAN